MKQFFVFLVSLFTFCNVYSQNTKETLSMTYTFNSDEELTDWFIEGEGKATIENGQLILEPLYFPLMEVLMKNKVISDNNFTDEYYPYLIPAMRAKYGEQIRNYYLSGKGEPQFMGGHFNIWNQRIKTSRNFAIEFDFTPLSPAPLHMLMFCASGPNGESIFDTSLPTRYGIEDELLYDMTMYRVSFFHKLRKKANLRLAPGKILVAQGIDTTSDNLTQTSHCRIERIEGIVKFITNGKEIFSYKEEKQLEGNNWGFRLMSCAKGAYDNIRVLTIQ